jgi:hypothetical protein
VSNQNPGQNPNPGQKQNPGQMPHPGQGTRQDPKPGHRADEPRRDPNDRTAKDRGKGAGKESSAADRAGKGQKGDDNS